jgi:hypothetical protein
VAFEEKRAWIMAALAVCAYGTYLAVVLAGAGGAPLAEASYAAALLWTVGAAVVAQIVLDAVVSAVSQDARQQDQRDREILRFGDHVGQSFVVVGGVAALCMAMAELHHFWIANALYAGFALSAVLGSAAKIVAYRRGFQPW